MQGLRNSILAHVRIRVCMKEWFVSENVNALSIHGRLFCTSACTNNDQVKAQVIELVKKFDKIDASKVTEAADFQKDLSFDSLDKVELVMAFEEEFSIEIPDEKADKFKSCADVAEYIISEAEQNVAKDS